MTTVYQLSDEDQALLNRYCEIDNDRIGGSVGEVFADENCTALVPNWREIAGRVIAKHS